MLDPRNAMSLAAILGALNRLAIDPHTFLNTDVMSLELKDLPIAVCLPEGCLERLNAEARGATSTGDSSKYRSLQLQTTISAAGELVCVVILIKDSSFKKLESVLVSAQVTFVLTCPCSWM